MTSNKPQVVHALRSDMPGLSRKLSKNAPPIDMPRSRRYETISIQATRESIHGYASFLSRAKTHGLPMPDMIEEDEGKVELTRAYAKAMLGLRLSHVPAKLHANSSYSR